jgi:CBS domain-containing protein
MPIVKTDSVFSGIPVSQAMRQQVVSLNRSADIGQGIRMMIRYKVNAVLLTDNGIPCGVVSKTDLMGALYAELSTEMPLGDVMGSQPIACFPDDPLEDALEIMEAAGLHRLYVTGADREVVNRHGGLRGYRGPALPLLPGLRTRDRQEADETRRGRPVGTSCREGRNDPGRLGLPGQ